MTIFTQARTGQTFLEEVDAPLGDMLRATAGEAFVTNPLAAMVRETELREAMEGPFGPQPPGSFPPRINVERTGVADSPIISAADARQRVTEAGFDLVIPEEGIPQRALEILMERKRAERLRQDAFARGPTGVVPGALRLGTSLAVSLLDPLNIGTAFIPVVGPARYAAMLARSSGIGRVGVRAGVGAVEGAAGAALVEPYILHAMDYEQADYDLTDSLLNVALGGVLGGGLHVVGGTALDVVQGRRAANAPPPSPVQRGIDAAAPETREAALRVRVAQMAQGLEGRIEQIFELDPNVRAASELPEGAIGPLYHGTQRNLTGGLDPERALYEGAVFFSSNRNVAQFYAGTPRPETARYTAEATKDVVRGKVQETWRVSDNYLRQWRPEKFPSKAAAEADAAKLSASAKPVPGVDAKIVEAHLVPKNPKAIDWGGAGTNRERMKAEVDQARAEGHDLLIVKNINDTYADDQYAVLDKSIIKERPTRQSGPVDQRAWAQVVSDAKLGGIQTSALADAGASRQADELLKAGLKSDTPQGLEQDVADAFESFKELAETLDEIGALDAFTRDSDFVVGRLESDGRAAEALAACTTRRGAA